MGRLNFKWLVAALVVTAVVILMTHLPPRLLPIGFGMKGMDKLAHLLAYGLITGLLVCSLKALSSAVMVCLVLTAIAALGAVDELTQPLVNRTACMRDWLADLLGTVSALLIFAWVNHSRQKDTENAGC